MFSDTHKHKHSRCKRKIYGAEESSREISSVALTGIRAVKELVLVDRTTFEPGPPPNNRLEP